MTITMIVMEQQQQSQQNEDNNREKNQNPNDGHERCIIPYYDIKPEKRERAGTVHARPANAKHAKAKA
eukprot:scaffold52650_cov37-Prasinocladus_malaysianus.AAC.1